MGLAAPRSPLTPFRVPDSWPIRTAVLVSHFQGEYVYYSGAVRPGGMWKRSDWAGHTHRLNKGKS